MPARPRPSWRSSPVLVLILAALASGCGERAAQPAAQPARQTATDRQRIDELSPADARRKGLLRTDALAVTGPAQVRAGGKAARIVFRIDVPATSHVSAVRATLTGSCDATFEDPAGRRSTTLQVRRRMENVPVRAAIPPGLAECYVTLDALVPGRAYTGDGQTVTVARS